MNSTINSVLCLFFALYLLSESNLHAQHYSGSYELETDGVSFSLILKQDEHNNLEGTLKGSDGSAFKVQGTVDQTVAAGILSGPQGILFFEAYADEQNLTLSYMAPDPFNMPDYNTAVFLVFGRSKEAFSGAPHTQEPIPENVPAQSPEQTGPQGVRPADTNMEMKSGPELVDDPVHGFSFPLPEGWVHQKANGQILMGSHTIAGLISVSPHQASNMQQLLDLMSQGLQEEGVYLTPAGQSRQMDQRRASGYYTGMVQGEQVKAYVVGLLNPIGGGIFVLALSTPDKLGEELLATADYVVSNARFTERETGQAELVAHFAGQWMWTNGYRTAWMTFFPDGSYSDQSEASYSGNLTDGSGNVTGNWGVAGQDSNRGRWTVQGNMDSGVITVFHPDGSQNRYEYTVFIERGKKFYREYLLNGYHYGKQKDF